MSQYDSSGVPDTNVRLKWTSHSHRIAPGRIGAVSHRHTEDPRLANTNPLFGYALKPGELERRLAVENTRPHWSSDLTPARLPSDSPVPPPTLSSSVPS